MNKLAKRLVIFAAAMVVMLASSLTVFAKENEAVPRIVDNVLYVDEGSNNVWIYGVAISIAGGNKTDIVPNNPSTKIDVMANGQVFKQLDGVVLLKDEKKDRVYLEAGSSVIEAPAITDKALATLKKAIADGKADSITATQILGTTADKGALAYQIAKNGKAVMTSGEELSKLLKTNANYISVLEAFEQAVAAAEEAAKEATASAPAAVESGCISILAPQDLVYVYFIYDECDGDFDEGITICFLSYDHTKIANVQDAVDVADVDGKSADKIAFVKGTQITFGLGVTCDDHQGASLAYTTVEEKVSDRDVSADNDGWDALPQEPLTLDEDYVLMPVSF